MEFLYSGHLEQEDGEFEASLDETVSSRLSWAVRPSVVGVRGNLCLAARSSLVALPLAVTL